MQLHKLSPRSNRREIIEWFEELSDEEQEAVFNSPDNRTDDEDADTFLKRVRAKRVINQTIDRYERKVANL